MMDAAETGGEDNDTDEEDGRKNEDGVNHHMTNVKKKIPLTEDELMGQVSLWIVLKDLE